MRFAAVVALALAAVASAATLAPRAGLPACANTCIQKTHSSCSKTNPGCLCKDHTFVTQAQNCCKAKCSKADQQTALAFFHAVCGTRFSGEAVTEDEAVVNN